MPATTPKGLASKGRTPAGGTGGLDARLARRELLELPARHLGGLPVAMRIGVQLSGFAHAIELVSRHRDAPAGTLTFDLEELRALAIATQAERIWAADFKGYCLLKLHEPSFRVTEILALGGAQPSAAPPWSLGQVLRGLDLALLGIELLPGSGEGTREHDSEAGSSGSRQSAAAA
jgi:hypothetical protein